MPSLKDLAKECGVSVATVSKALLARRFGLSCRETFPMT